MIIFLTLTVFGVALTMLGSTVTRVWLKILSEDLRTRIQETDTCELHVVASIEVTARDLAELLDTIREERLRMRVQRLASEPRKASRVEGDES